MELAQAVYSWIHQYELNPGYRRTASDPELTVTRMATMRESDQDEQTFANAIDWSSEKWRENGRQGEMTGGTM